MTREEIREGIARELSFIDKAGQWDNLSEFQVPIPQMSKHNYRCRADMILKVLHLQGVVIKVDSDAEKVARLIDSDRPFAIKLIKMLKDKADYVAVESLMGK